MFIFSNFSITSLSLLAYNTDQSLTLNGTKFLRNFKEIYSKLSTYTFYNILDFIHFLATTLLKYFQHSIMRHII